MKGHVLKDTYFSNVQHVLRFWNCAMNVLKHSVFYCFSIQVQSKILLRHNFFAGEKNHRESLYLHTNHIQTHYRN